LAQALKRRVVGGRQAAAEAARLPGFILAGSGRGPRADPEWLRDRECVNVQ
jgi:hypothetical protein